MSSPFISVIVPVSRTDTVEGTIKGLLNQSIPQDQFEIILIIPATLNFKNPKPSRIDLVKTEKLFPPGKMRNIGAKKAQGEILCFLDDDCKPAKEWLKVITENFNQNRKIGAVGCRVVSSEDIFWHRCADYALFSRYQHTEAFYGSLGSAAIAIKKVAFESVNGFHETLLASEDWDISLKLADKGWLCFFDPLIEVKHEHGRGCLTGVIIMGFKSGIRSGLFVQNHHKKHMTRPALILLKFRNPFIYPFVMIPYAILLSLHIIWDLKNTDSRLFIFAPFIFMSRIAYQIGVWTNLIRRSQGL